MNIETNPGLTLFISRLRKRTTEDKIIDYFSSFCQSQPKVILIRSKNGRSKCIALVELESPETVDLVINKHKRQDDKIIAVIDDANVLIRLDSRYIQNC